MWQHNVFFFYLDISHLEETVTYHRQLHVNEIEVADIDEAYWHTKNGTCCRNSNVIDLLTIFKKSFIPDTWGKRERERDRKRQRDRETDRDRDATTKINRED